MRIVRLQVEGFKRLEVVDITPEGDLVEVRGNNGNGKSSVLDAIFCALAGAAVAPVKPVREGEEMAIIRVDLGELVVTRIFTDDGTTRLKVTNADGTATFTEGQTMLNKLLGHIAFDPLEFARLKPDEQAEQLRQLVEIEADLDALAKVRKENFDNRRDLNRDAKALKARLDSIPKVDKPETLPDRNALVGQLEEAANKNAALEKEISRRNSLREQSRAAQARAESHSENAANMRREAEKMEEAAAAEFDVQKKLNAEIEALPALGEAVDVSALREQISKADQVADVVRQIQQRESLEKQYSELAANVAELTASIENADKQRNEAIAAAKMPVEGLSLVVDEETDKLSVTFNGIPFSQASSAEQLRVSTAVAMAANPELRVIRIKDGSLLDKNSLSILREMATENDFQIWGEFVGDEGAGIIMEAGRVRGAPDPEPLDRPRRRKVADVDNATEKKTDSFPLRETVSDEAFDVVTGEIIKTDGEQVATIPAKPEQTILFDTPPEPRKRARALTEFRTAPRATSAEGE
jgi:hypothetical protein